MAANKTSQPPQSKEKSPAPEKSSVTAKSTAPSNPASAAQPPAQVDRVLQALARFERVGWDIAGVVFVFLAAVTLLAIFQLTSGTLLSRWAGLLRGLFGWGSLMLVAALAALGMWMLFKNRATQWNVNWVRLISLEVAAFSGVMLLTLIGGSSSARAQQGLDGGQVGWGLVELLRIPLKLLGFSSPTWGYLLVLPIFFLAFVYGSGLLSPLIAWLDKVSRLPAGQVSPEPDTGLSVAPLEPQEPAILGTEAPNNKKKKTVLPPQYRKNFRLPLREESNTPPPPRDDRLPPLDLLSNEMSSRPDERNINLTAGLIEKTLSEFGIPAKVVGFRVGPTVTQFAVEPGFVEKPGSTEEETRQQKVRVAQISSLQRDLALSLSADRLRIEAPVPGRPYVGIEVPNTRSSVVRLRPILENEAFYRYNSPLAIAFGRDVSGQPVVADLTNMPHLLIAGTTGSGKSVCIAALTACLVMNNTPEDLRLVMIDPKMVELVRFNGLPHLLGKVETDIQRILGVLRWTVMEMDRRYKLLEQMNARHLESYNRKVRRRKGGETLPRLVVMIDELADLMMSAPDQTEPALVRLAQLARATGIHLVVATQRPSTDVVTGLIKANFPARIAFAVASSIDSRVILDTTGAESLLGRGDMLFNPPDAAAPIRSQGVMVTDQEIERIITFWQKSNSQDQPASPPWETMLAEEEVLADRDDLVTKAIEVVRREQKCSASMLQRRLRIGFPRAARLVEELEDLGIVGPAGAGREREVLVSDDEEGDDREDDE